MNTTANKLSLKKFTYVLLVSCLLGVNFFSINLGAFQLSLYRMLILLSPLFFENVFKSLVQTKNATKKNQYVKLLFFWVLYSLITLLWVYDYLAWVKTFSFLLTGSIVSYFIFAFIKNRSDFIKSLLCIEFFSIGYGILALYEIFTGNYLFVVEKNLEYFTERSLALSAIGFREPVAVFGNPNDFALFLFFSLLSSVCLFHVKKTLVSKIISGFVITLSIFLIFCTQSRSVFFGISVFIFTYTFFEFLRFSIIKKVYFFVFLVIILFSSLWILNENSDLFRDLTTVNIFSADEGSSDSIRKNLIINGFYFLLSTFGMGVGLGNIEYYMVNNAIFEVGNVQNIHNWWMEILVSSGVIVFIYYLIIYFKSMFILMKISWNTVNLEVRKLTHPLQSFFPAFIIAAVGSSSLMGSEWIWPLMALVIGAPYILKNDEVVNG